MLSTTFKSCHRLLDEMFLQHQEMLLQGRLQEAAEILRGYERCHQLHMRYEDEVLIPKYIELQEPGRWNATLYQLEHQKLRDLYEKIVRTLAELCAAELDASQKRRNIIYLLDRQKSFKGLCEHHQEREEAALFVDLETRTDSNWQQQIVETFMQTWTPCLERQKLLLNALL